MKVKDIIFIQNAMHEAMDFIDANCDGDQTEIGSNTIADLSKSINLLQKKKEAIYLQNAKVRLKKLKT